jgi:hypothetical protein
MKRILWTLAIAGLVWTTRAQVSGVTNTLTLPVGFDTVPGSHASPFPLQSQLVHQLLYGTVFDTTEVIKLTELRYRLDEGASSLDVVVHRLTFSMSTYVRPLDEFTTFTRDTVGIHGPDVAIVYDQRDIVIDATSAPDGQASPFDIVFPLQKPFYYDPKMGHLLIEIFAPEGSQASRNLDAHFTLERPGQMGILLGKNTALEGGLASQIRYEVVPEPSATALVAMGLAWTAMRLWGRRQSTVKPQCWQGLPMLR